MARRALVLVVLALALAAPTVAAAANAELARDRGVVQSVDAGEIVLRALDGTVATFPLGPATRVYLNGVRVTLAEIRPGLVATVVHDGAEPAAAIRATGKTLVTDRGTVLSLTRSEIVLATASGGTITIQLDRRTRFRLRGRPVRRAAARAGAIVAVKHPFGGAATRVNVLRRARR
jgi:hypothetical protein